MLPGREVYSPLTCKFYMFIRRIDRYVSRSFLVPFVGILFLIFGLYVAFDLLKRVDDLQKLGMGEALPMLLKYYGYVFPVFILDSVPTVILVAAGLTLVKMARSRELLILKASGVSLHRVMVPIFAWTLIISTGVFWAKENLVPQFVRNKALAARRLERDLERSIMLRDEQHNFTLYVNEYAFSGGQMKKVSVMEFYSSGQIKRMIEADEGYHSGEGMIELKRAIIEEYDKRGVKVGDIQEKAALEMETSLSRYDFVRAKQEAMRGQSMYMELPDLAKKMRKQSDIPHFQVSFHSRLASAFIPFILLLIGVPVLVGFEHSAHSRFLGIIVCVFVAAAYYVMIFVCTSMGQTGVIDPVIAGWLPVIVGGSSGVFLFESMLT